MPQPPDSPRLLAGAMSGTSGDGIDIAITRVSGRGLSMKVQLVRHHHIPYEPALRAHLFAVRDAEKASLKELADLGREISLSYARGVNETLVLSNLNASDLSAIAAHGQTLFHDPPNTIQWFDPSLLAAETGCQIVSDFRRADCAAGGQGAPLVPLADYILFRDTTKTRVLLNIGGIANITHIPAGASIDALIAFDTGPGNCISDYLCRKHIPSGPGYDEGGKIAQTGAPLHKVFMRFVEHEYFSRRPPKSTDGPEMIRSFELLMHQFGGPEVALRDQLSTACLITQQTILRAFHLLAGPVDEVIASGGGTENPLILDPLRKELNVRLADELGVPSAAKEAIAFALLGAATLDGIPSNVPSVTGARRPVMLGSITPKP
jgi:anhydro-N-acetylmuramic acid kinase